MNKKQKRELLSAGICIVVSMVIWWATTSWTMRDLWMGAGYEPSEDVQEMLDELELTSEGRRIFKASRPVLEGSTEFNEHCDSHSAEIALLGCYAGGQIYVYNITNGELADANKVTMAHELLHAAWLRMSDSEKQKITELMNQVAEANTEEWRDEELGTYDQDPNTLTEETYVRVGTKIRDLPEELEGHYARYFQNRAKIVDFYENYQKPLDELREKTEKLGEEIEEERKSLEKDREDYEVELEGLNREIDQFNLCADTVGCFTSEGAFQSRRNGLNARSEGLEVKRVELNAQIDQINAKINEYQQNLQNLGELNDAMNSNAIESL